MKRTSLPILLVCASIFGFGCGDDAPAPKPTCERIVEACHLVDPGIGPLHDCHQNAESAAATEAMCVAASTSCFMICAAAAVDSGTTDSGIVDDAGHHDHDGGPADDAGSTDDAGTTDDAGADDAGPALDLG